MTAEEILELSDLNYAEALREMSRRAGGVVHDEDGVLYLLWRIFTCVGVFAEVGWH